MEVFIVQSKEIEGRIDPHFYRPEFKTLVNTIKKRPFQKLTDLIEFSSETWDQQGIYENEFPYIEISEIDVNSGEIQNVQQYKIADAPSRAKMIVREEDIIISTTRPNRGAIALIEKSKDGFIASTGFSVLRKIKNTQISRKYLFYVLRTRLSLTQMLQRTSGGNYPAITSEELEKILIPVPPPETQEKIVRLMDDAYAEKRKKEDDAQRLMDSVDDYVLNELGVIIQQVEDKKAFAVYSGNLERRLDPFYYRPDFIALIESLNNSKFDVKTLGHLSTKIINGLDFREFTENGKRYIRVANLKPNHFDFSDVKFIPDMDVGKDIGLSEGDLLITRKGTYGVALAVEKAEDFIISSEVFRVLLKKEIIDPFYAAVWLNTVAGKKYFDRIKTGGIMGHISQEALKEVKIPVPPLAVQNRIASEVRSRLEKADSLRREAVSALVAARCDVERIILGSV